MKISGNINKLSSHYIDIFVDRVEGLTRPQRILIFCGTFLLVAALFLGLLIYPKYEEIGKLEKEYKTVERKLVVAKNKAKQLEQLRKLEEEAKIKFKLAMRALPEKKEIPLLLTSISDVGKEAGLEFLLFKPQPARRRDFYEEIPVSVEVLGSYHQTALFFDLVANLPRVVNVRNITMAPTKSGNILRTKCTPVTYRFIEENENQKGGKRKK